MKKITSTILVSILSLGIVCPLVSCGSGSSATVKLNDYITIESEGYDGYGTVSYTFDEDSFMNDYSDKVAYKSETNKEKPSASATQSLLEHVSDSGYFTNDKDLSNGDKVTFTWDTSDFETVENLYAVNLDYSDIEYTVEGLSELEQVDIIDGGELNGDAFEGITVKFSGTSPQGTASVNTDGSIDGVTPSMFTLNKSSWLSNGETVTVTMTDEDIEELAERCGIIPTVTEKEFTVEGLAYYPMDASQIPEDAFKTAQSRAYDDYYTELSNEWASHANSQNRKLVSINNLGYYYYVNEESGTNDLIFVFETNAYQKTLLGDYEEESISDPVNFYWFAYYSDIIVDDNGIWIVPSSHYTLTDMLGEDEASFTLEFLYGGNGWAWTDTLTYEGYQYLDEMNRDIKLALPNYTLVNDTVSGIEGEGTNANEVEQNN